MGFAKKEAPKPLISSDFRGFLSQEQEDSNPRHLVLEKPDRMSENSISASKTGTSDTCLDDGLPTAVFAKLLPPLCKTTFRIKVSLEEN